MLSTGILPIVVWLAVCTVTLAVLAGLVLALTHQVDPGSSELGVLEATWISLLRTLDPGTMGQDVGWPLRVTSLCVTIAGIFGLSALIGLVSSAIDRRIERLRKGRSLVVETGHTLVLGWSSKLRDLLSEVVLANANQRDAVIVVLAPKDKVEMDDYVHAHFPNRGTTKIVCRHGDPAHVDDLRMVGFEAARSIIVLCPDDGGDAHVIRTVLALQVGGAPSGIVVAELSEPRNAAALRSATKGVLTVASGEVIGQITAQVCRQAGLGVVYQDLLDFQGDEIYFHEEPALVGKTFGHALLAYDTSAVIGLCREGIVDLNPHMNAAIEVGDKVVAISADDDTIRLSDVAPSSIPRCEAPRVPEVVRENILMVGWNDLGPLILRELDGHLATGSSLDVVIDPELLEVRQVNVDTALANIRIEVAEAPVRDASRLRSMLAQKRYDRIVLLCYAGLSATEADSLTLLSLLQLRQILKSEPELGGRLTLVTELRDLNDVELARLTGADDFIVSDRLMSLMLAHLSENPALHMVFNDLFDAKGSVICARPASDYAELGCSTLVREIVAAGCSRGESVIGYRSRLLASPGVIVNPDKRSQVVLLEGDEVIVVATRPLAPGEVIERATIPRAVLAD